MKQLWINLPVSDLNRAKEFFSIIGVAIMENQSKTDQMVGLLVGNPQVQIMLFQDEQFKRFTQSELTNTNESTEVLFSISIETKEELDETIKKVKKAGGFVYSEPVEQNGLYGAGFADLDGHRWNLLVM
ncbi:extradiol dioxygenase [Planococcus sp. PAMC 21323]|uniref:VOC family protein n=1 Tax=Planococcus sp. PAMC 21323 TaxID=1526927 RepID=UPI000571ECBF|nr:VOC family protein [Planococcus sp. PAMC 21323]AIY05462.1 extradiol dioxygenase [Planococcus sp. PAMC 21323]